MAVIAAGIDKALAKERGGEVTLTCPVVVDDEIPESGLIPIENDETLRIERPGIDKNDDELIVPDSNSGQ